MLHSGQVHGSGVSPPTRSGGTRRKQLLLALVDQHADSLYTAVDELGRWIDHLRQVGIGGFLAEHTNDSDSAKPPGKLSADKAARTGTADEPARDGSGPDAPRN